MKIPIPRNIIHSIVHRVTSFRTPPVKPLGALNEKLSVVLTCHDAYLKWLPRCIESINRQEGIYRKVLVYEGSRLPPDIEGLKDWEVITGTWGSPNPARNLGLKKAGTPWIIFFDADNVMPQGYTAAMLQAIDTAGPDVGLIYPDVHFYNSAMKVHNKFHNPDWDRWTLSRKNYIDTSAAWRVDALELIGGWKENIPTEDDYWLALELARRGWRGGHISSVATIHVDHIEEPGRWNMARDAGQESEALWQIRTMCIVTVFSGQSEWLSAWRNYLLLAKIPPRTDILMVDNSGDDDFHMVLADSCRLILRSGRFRSVTLRKIDSSYQSSFDTLESVHEPWQLQIAKVYAEILPEITDDLIFTLEEGVIPRDPDAIWKLHEVLVDDYCAAADIGAVCAAYASLTSKGNVTASYANNKGGVKMVRASDLNLKPIEVSCIGAGCTIWPNWALRRALPIVIRNDGGIGSWDTELCRSLRRNGYRIILHGGVICDNICPHVSENI